MIDKNLNIIGMISTPINSIWGTFDSLISFRMFILSNFNVKIANAHTISTSTRKISKQYYKLYQNFFNYLNLDLIDVQNKSFQELYIFWNF